MRLATVIPFPSKLRTIERATPVAERQRQNEERQASVDEIIRRRQILELFVEAAGSGCGSSSLRRRWDTEEREYAARAEPLTRPIRKRQTDNEGDRR